MIELPGKLNPPMVTRPWRRDAVLLAVLAGLAVCLLPTLPVDFAAVLLGRAPANVAGDPVAAEEFFDAQSDLLLQNVSGRMASVYLLPALGIVLCLRRGLVDLSVWAVMGLGGVLAAWGINAGLAPLPAILFSVAASSVPGALAAVAVLYLRVPSAAATLVLAALIVLAFHLGTDPAGQAGFYADLDVPGPPPGVEVASDAFAGWHIVERLEVPAAPSADGPAAPAAPRAYVNVTRPLYVTRMVLVVSAYGLVVATLMVAGWIDPRQKRLRQRWGGAVALVASAALSALGGALWLLDHGAAPMPYRLVGELRVPAAAICAGATFLAWGHHRNLLSVILLPGTLLLAGLWEMNVWDLPFRSYWLQTLVLAGGVGGVFYAFAEAFRTRRGQRAAWPPAGLVLAGLLVVAAAGRWQEPPGRLLCHGLGSALWLAGVAWAWAIRRRRAGRQARQKMGLA